MTQKISISIIYLQTKPLTVFTAVSIWILAIIFATPAIVMSDAVTIVLSNVTNRSIITCSPFGPFESSKTYTQ